MAVANTGMETVDHISLEGKLLSRWDLLENETDVRVINSTTDYRIIPDTKPHLRHANHIFVRDGEMWITQLRTKDAICLTYPRKRISIDAGMPHDGEIYEGEIVFTTTNGHLVLASAGNLTVDKSVDLNKIPTGYNQLGWCRGAWKINRTEYLVGFSTIRRSKWRDFGYFVKHGHDLPPSRISHFDVVANRLQNEWRIGSRFGFQLFQFEVLPRQRWL